MNTIVKNTTALTSEEIKAFINTKDAFNLNLLPREKPTVITFTGFIIVDVTTGNGNSFRKIVFDASDGICYTSGSVFLENFEKMMDDITDKLSNDGCASIEVMKKVSKNNPDRCYLVCNSLTSF